MSTILVVDDWAIVCEPIAAALRHEGFHTICASSGRKALEIARNQPPDLILVDLAMPEMDGLQFIEQFWKQDEENRRVPIIILTGVMDRKSVVQAARMGVCEFMLKSGFSLRDMVARVRKRLEQVSVPATTEQSAVTVGSHADSATAAKPTTVWTSPGQTCATSYKSAASPPQPVCTPGSTSPAAPVRVPFDGSQTAALETLRTIKPIISRAQLLEIADQCGEIKAMSPTVSQLLHMTSPSGGASIDQVVRVIRQDQAMALKILKLANSVIYTRGDPVESVHLAVMRIGLQPLRQAVLNLSVVEHFGTVDPDLNLSMPEFWEHSIACGLIAAEITHGRGGTTEEADAAFTMGLLHDAGRMMYAQQLSDLYHRVIETAIQLRLPLEQVESRMLLINHAEVMDRLLHRWRFPKHLINPIALHHLSINDIRQTAPNMIEPVTVLALANRLAHALLLGSSGNPTIYPTDELFRAIKLKPETLQRIRQTIPDQTQDMKLAMINRANTQEWVPPIQHFRQLIGQPLHPLVICEEPDIDACAILAQVLSDPPSDQLPNLAIIHLTQGRHRAPLTDRLLQAEQSAGLPGPLPTLLISPTGQLELMDQAMKDRHCEKLAIPFALPRFTDAVKKLLA